MTVLLLVVGAMLLTVLLVGVGERINLPWPVLLLVVGAGAAFVPGIHVPEVEPELILPLFLPPLLYATAQRTSWALFRARWRSIAFLAVALVLVTAATVALTVWALLPTVTLAAALAVGAAVAPPDPVAVEAVAGPLRMPRRLVATLQSEGLFNDATALVLFQAAVAVATLQRTVGFGLLGLFVWGAGAAVAIGLVAAELVRRLVRRLTDSVAINALSLVLPFAVYLAADAASASGVIAVVVAALQRRQHADAEASEVRLTGGAFWSVVEMLVTGVAFALMGLELRTVVDDAGTALGGMLRDAGVVCGVVLVIRVLWMTTAVLPNRRRDPAVGAAPRTRAEALVLAWSGMRGLATLALALGLPVTAGDAPFPDRSELVLIATSVLVVTLVLPGFTLGPLLRRLGVRESETARHEAEKALALRARRAALDELAAADRELLGVDDEVGDQVLEEMRARFSKLTASLSREDAPPDGDDESDDAGDDYRERMARLQRRRGQWTRLQAIGLAAARREVLSARTEPGVDPELADRVLQRLDQRSVALPGM